MKKYFIVIFILFVALNLHSLIVMNDLNCIFTDGSEKILIEDNVVAGAIHFLHSKANTDLLLVEFEKSARQDFNFSLALEYVEKAMAELEAAKVNYARAAEIGERIGYIEKKMAWFKDYDYDTFITKNNLNKEIAGIVKGYLINADILGVYKHSITNINELLNILTVMRDKVKVNEKPGISTCWMLLQKYSDTTLFGNYSTQMGLEILSNCEE
jgi:hypothetical protein